MKTPLLFAAFVLSLSAYVAGEDQPSEDGCSLVLRIQRESIERNEEPFNTINQVKQEILGTHAIGKCDTAGKLSIRVAEDSNKPRLLLSVKGQTQTNTVGNNGPAKITCTAVSDFYGTSEILFDLNKGFVATPVKLTATTKLSINDIQSTLPGLRGAVVRRVAWRRANESHAEATAIAARETEKDLNAGMNAAVAKDVANLNAQWNSVKPIISLLQMKGDLQMCAKEADEPVSLFLGKSLPTTLPTCKKESQVEIWLKSKMASRFFSTTEIVQTWKLPISEARSSIPWATMLSLSPIPAARPTLPVTAHGEWLVLRLPQSKDAKPVSETISVLGAN